MERQKEKGEEGKGKGEREKKLLIAESQHKVNRFDKMKIDFDSLQRPLKVALW
jgi:hypothetical protein